MIAIYMFHNVSRGFPRLLAFGKHKHMNFIMYDGENSIKVEKDHYGINLFHYNISDYVKLLDVLVRIKTLTAYVVVRIYDEPRLKFKWFPIIGNTCNEIARLMTKIDIGLTLTPVHFYSKLIKYNQRKNFEILKEWRR